jgi:DNA-binding transcriptional regulator YhcF (GntR family)
MPVTPPLLTLNPLDPIPLVEQIVAGIKRLTEERVLRVGTRLPSIRNFAVQHSVSRFTVVDAYDRLVAFGVSVFAPWLRFLRHAQAAG